jgi:hypothetical protein
MSKVVGNFTLTAAGCKKLSDETAKRKRDAVDEKVSKELNAFLEEFRKAARKSCAAGKHVTVVNLLTITDSLSKELEDAIISELTQKKFMCQIIADGICVQVSWSA